MIQRLLLALLILAMGSLCFAQERPVYQPVGAPADPKVSVRWNRYYDHAEASDILKRLAKAYPKFAKLESLGKSYGGREMWVMTITDPETGKADEKPAFWIDGGIHANEIQSVEVVLYTAWYLLETHERNEFIGKLLKERTFYLAPMLSPDSRDAHFYEPNSTHSPRTGQRPFDDDRDGRVDEDGYDDLNNDGHITQMRIRDPNGKWKPHEKYPNLMVRVQPDEQGQYTLLGREGIDNDDDGEVNEDGDGYYDPNRDWAWNWQPEYVQRGAHRYPFSILENRMIADFVKQHPNIAGAQSYHNTGGMILRGPGAKTDRYEAADVAVYTKIGKLGEEMLPGYRYLNVAEDLYEVYGGELDWFYAMQGIFCYTNELFTPFNFFRKPGGGFFANEETLHKFNKYLLFGDGFVDWEEVEHPQYGTIEVGGFKKNWMRQPPSFLLEEECHRNMAFTLYHADQLPLVRVSSVTTKAYSDEITEVVAIIENPKLQPTHAAVDVKNHITKADEIRITAGDDLQVMVAFTDDEFLFRNPKPDTDDPRVVKVDNIAGNGIVYVKWLVRGKGPYTISVQSIKGGTAKKRSE